MERTIKHGVMILLMVMTALACEEEEILEDPSTVEIAVTSLQLSQTSLTLSVGAVESLPL